MHKNLHALVGELDTRSAQIAIMELAALLPDEPLLGKLINLANIPTELDRVARAIDGLVDKAGLTIACAKTALRNLLIECSFYGQYCELGAYEWLHRHGVAFKAKIQLAGQDVLNPNGCTIDGWLHVVDAYFDVKAFGFQERVGEEFRKRLEQRIPGFTITVA